MILKVFIGGLLNVEYQRSNKFWALISRIPLEISARLLQIIVLNLFPILAMVFVNKILF